MASKVWRPVTTCRIALPQEDLPNTAGVLRLRNPAVTFQAQEIKEAGGLKDTSGQAISGLVDMNSGHHRPGRRCSLPGDWLSSLSRGTVQMRKIVNAWACRGEQDRTEERK